MNVDPLQEARGIRAVLEMCTAGAPGFPPPPDSFSYPERVGWEKSSAERREEWLRARLQEAAEALETLAQGETA